LFCTIQRRAMATEQVLLPKPPLFLRASAASGPDEAYWLEVSGLEKYQAEQLLDWLETNGYERRKVAVGAGGRMVVRYVARPTSGPDQRLAPASP
jgi:hypothetical protein